MKYIIVLTFVFGLSCTQSAKKSQRETDTVTDKLPDFQYPKEILKNNKLVNLYNESRWLLYCIHCDDTCKFFNQPAEIKTMPLFGTMQLKSDGMQYFHDTIELYLSFYYDTIACDVHTAHNPNITAGVAFKDYNDSAIYYVKRTTFYRYNETGTASRYVNPLQPDVVNFIKNNKEKLNPWFRAEAIRRGVIQ